MYFYYHRSNDHDTNKCNTLKNDIEEIIKKGKFEKYVKKDEEHQRYHSTHKGKVMLNEVGKA